MSTRPLLFLALLLVGTPCAAQALRVFYIEKPPYYHSVEGEPTGFLLERSRAIFAAAGIAVQFESRPTKRILMEVADPQASFCSIGWFKTAERAQLVWFSQPIHRDEPMQVLTRSTLQGQLREVRQIEQLLNSPLRLGLVDGFSYGAIDQRLAQQPARQRITAPPLQIVMMLLNERIDYTLVDSRELPYLIGEADLSQGRLSQLSLADMPPGQLRYLMCGKGLEKNQRAAINRAIQQLELKPD